MFDPEYELEHRPFTNDGYTPCRSTTSFVSMEYRIEVEKTTLDQVPPELLTRSGCRQRSPQIPPQDRKPGRSKYPFGLMEVGNSFILPLQVFNQMEFHRVKKCVLFSQIRHIRMGHLPADFLVKAKQIVRNGVHGIAFYRVQ